MPPVFDQGKLGSCTANALCCLMQVEDGMMGSRLFLYYNERGLEGTISRDAGATLADGIRSLKTQGVCPELLWPYVAAKFAVKPPAPCYAIALKHEALSVYAVTLTLKGLKAALTAGHPIAIGLRVYASFQSPLVSKTGEVPLPKKGEALLGGHAVVVVGFRDSTEVFLMRNSWGPSWGDRGYFTVPYAYLTSGQFVTEAWVISAAT